MHTGRTDINISVVLLLNSGVIFAVGALIILQGIILPVCASQTSSSRCRGYSPERKRLHIIINTGWKIRPVRQFMGICNPFFRKNISVCAACRNKKTSVLKSVIVSDNIAAACIFRISRNYQTAAFCHYNATRSLACRSVGSLPIGNAPDNLILIKSRKLIFMRRISAKRRTAD